MRIDIHLYGEVETIVAELTLAATIGLHTSASIAEAHAASMKQALPMLTLSLTTNS